MKRLRFSIIALIALTFGLVSLASAQRAGSTPIGWNDAELDVSIQGTVANQASFEVASVNFVLDTFQLAPGQTFSISIRVWNTTGDRAIQVSNDPSFSGVGGVISASNTSGNVVIPAGAYRDMVWEIQVLNGITSYLGQTHTVTMRLYGEGIGPYAQNVNFR